MNNLATRGLAVTAQALPARSTVFIVDAELGGARRWFDDLVATLPEDAVSSVRRTNGSERIVLVSGTTIRTVSLGSLDRLRGHNVHLFALTDHARRQAFDRRLDLREHFGPCLATTGGEVAYL